MTVVSSFPAFFIVSSFSHYTRKIEPNTGSSSNLTKSNASTPLALRMSTKLSLQYLEAHFACVQSL
jgi:hypothetical protein